MPVIANIGDSYVHSLILHIQHGWGCILSIFSNSLTTANPTNSSDIQVPASHTTWHDMTWLGSSESVEGCGSHPRHNFTDTRVWKTLKSTSFTILYYNSWSLPKIDKLIVAANVHDPDLICITEWWLNSNILDSDSNFRILGYQPCCLDRDRHGEGVLPYIKAFNLTLVPTPNNIELLSAFVQHNSISTRVCLCPPSSAPEILDHLCEHLDYLNIQIS